MVPSDPLFQKESVIRKGAGGGETVTPSRWKRSYTNTRMSAQTPEFLTLRGPCAVRLIQTSRFHLRCASMCGGAGGGGEERVGVIFLSDGGEGV